MPRELADEVEHHLQWLHAVKTALLVPYAVHDERQERAAANLERAIGAAERLRARLGPEIDAEAGRGAARR